MLIYHIGILNTNYIDCLMLAVMKHGWTASDRLLSSAKKAASVNMISKQKLQETSRTFACQMRHGSVRVVNSIERASTTCRKMTTENQANRIWTSTSRKKCRFTYCYRIWYIGLIQSEWTMQISTRNLRC